MFLSLHSTEYVISAFSPLLLQLKVSYETHKLLARLKMVDVRKALQSVPEDVIVSYSYSFYFWYYIKYKTNVEV